MHIESTKHIENNTATINYDLEEKFYKRSQDLYWGDSKKIEKAVTNAENNKNKTKDLWKNNKRLKKRRYA